MKDMSYPVKLFTPATRFECPNCYYDKLTDKSTGTCKWTVLEAMQKQEEYEDAGGVGVMFKFFTKGRCPVCHSQGYFETQKTSYVSCNVKWDPSVSEGSTNKLVAHPSGMDGSTVVLLKTDTKYFNDFKNCAYMEVDGLKCKLSAPPLVRGIGSDALLIVAAYTTEKYSPPDAVVQKIYNLGTSSTIVLSLSDGTLLELSDDALLALT